ncbi:MAG: hypothetical protein IT379_14240 [Deltaproteobacteria bacterium]|nr:hypothetical protein [Deltaproteobacteria bacterium]
MRIARSATPWLVSCCACVAACGSSASRAVSTGSERSDAQPSPATVEMFWRGGPELAFMARSDEGDAFVHQGLRVTMRDGRSEVADDVFVGTVVAASRQDGVWWFLGSDGTLWRAPSFLGRPQRAGRIELRGAVPAGTSNEGILVVHPAPVGDLYRVRAGVARRIGGLPQGGVVGGAFLDARRGVAVLDGGVLARTDDGGATWAPLRIRDEVVGVHAIGDSYRVLFRGDTRRLRLAHDGTTHDLDRELARTDTMSPFDALRVVADLELPASGHATAGLVGAPIAVVERLRSAPSDASVFILPNGRLPGPRASLPSTQGAAFFGPRLSETLQRAFEPLEWGGTTSTCHRASWGAGAAAWCAEPADGDTAEPGWALHRVVPSGDSERTDVVLPTTAFRLLDDGLGVAWAGGCAPEEAGERDRTRLCWVPDVRAPSPLVVAVSGRVSSGAGNWLVVEQRVSRLPGALPSGGDDEDDGEVDDGPFWGVEHHPPLPVERVLVERVRGPDGRARAVTRPVPRVPSGFTIESAALTGDATLVVVARATRGSAASAALLVGSPGRALDRRTLPPGVSRHVAFADAARGIAVGSDATRLYRTLDGGRTWEHVALPIDGEATRVPLAVDGSRVRVFCTPARCGINVAAPDLGSWTAHVSIRGWGPVRVSRTHRLVVADEGPQAQPAPPPPPAADCDTEPTWFGTIACEPAGAGAAPEATSRGVGRTAVVGGWVEVAQAGAPGRQTARLRWWGQDDAGDFEGAAGPFPAWRDLGEDGFGRLGPEAVSRRGVLLTEEHGEQIRLRFARVGDRDAALVLRSEVTVAVPSIVSLPASDARFATVREERGSVEVTSFAADGGPERNRSFVLARLPGVPAGAASHVGVARDGDTYLAVAPIGDSPSAWRAFALDRSELPRTYGVLGGPLPTACRAAAPAGPIAVVPAVGLEVAGTVARRPRGVEIELGTERVCIRAIHWDGRLAADGSGRFVGQQRRGATSVPVSCTLTGASRARPDGC